MFFSSYSYLNKYKVIEVVFLLEISSFHPNEENFRPGTSVQYLSWNFNFNEKERKIRRKDNYFKCMLNMETIHSLICVGKC